MDALGIQQSKNSFHVKSHQNHAYITTMMSLLPFEMSAHAASLCYDERQTR